MSIIEQHFNRIEQRLNKVKFLLENNKEKKAIPILNKFIRKIILFFLCHVKVILNQV